MESKNIVTYSAQKGQETKADPDECQQEKVLGSAPVEQSQKFSEPSVGINVPAGPAENSFGGEVQFPGNDQTTEQMIVSAADDDSRHTGTMI